MTRQARDDWRHKVFYVGVDLAKRKHSAAVIRDDGKRLVRGFGFPNTKEGFEALLARLASAGAHAAESQVCLEATGHYGRNLMAFLEARGYEVFEVNPLLTASWRRATSVRKVRTTRSTRRRWRCGSWPGTPRRAGVPRTSRTTSGLSRGPAPPSPT